MKVFENCKKAAIALIVLGCIIFIWGLVATEHIEYGGDAYTGIQNAAADTSNNVLKACGILVGSLGIVLSNFCEIKVFEYEKNQKNHKELLKAVATGEMPEIQIDIQDETTNEITFTEYVEQCQCEVCFNNETEKKYRIKTDNSEKEIPICKTCLDKLRKK